MTLFPVQLYICSFKWSQNKTKIWFLYVLDLIVVDYMAHQNSQILSEGDITTW